MPFLEWYSTASREIMEMQLYLAICLGRKNGVMDVSSFVCLFDAGLFGSVSFLRMASSWAWRDHYSGRKYLHRYY